MRAARFGESRGLHLLPANTSRSPSDALVCLVSPFKLDGVAAEGAGLPGADVADFAVVVVVPALAGNGIGDSFAQLVRSRGGARIEIWDPSKTAGTTGIRHHGVENTVVDGVVIAAEDFAGGAAALGHGDSGRKENEIESVRGCGGQRACGDLLLQECLGGGGIRRFFLSGRRWRDLARGVK